MSRPNSTIQGNGFYVSYNARDCFAYGAITTALVPDNMERFYVLNGDHRAQYRKLIADGWDACLSYFIANADQVNKRSDFAPASLVQKHFFVHSWDVVAHAAYTMAEQKGFWEAGTERNNSEMIMLVVTELAEVVEALRHNNPPDDKIPEFSSVEVELADAVIRIMDLATARNWRVAEAILAKLKYNQNRPHKHGKEF